MRAHKLTKICESGIEGLLKTKNSFVNTYVHAQQKILKVYEHKTRLKGCSVVFEGHKLADSLLIYQAAICVCL